MHRTSGRTPAKRHTLAPCAHGGSPTRATFPGTSGRIPARSPTLARCAQGASATKAPLRRTSGRTPAKSPTLARCARGVSAIRVKLRRTSGPTPARSPTLALTAARRLQKVALPADMNELSTEEPCSHARAATRPEATGPSLLAFEPRRECDAAGQLRRLLHDSGPQRRLISVRRLGCFPWETYAPPLRCSGRCGLNGQQEAHRRPRYDHPDTPLCSVFPG